MAKVFRSVTWGIELSRPFPRKPQGSGNAIHGQVALRVCRPLIAFELIFSISLSLHFKGGFGREFGWRNDTSSCVPSEVMCSVVPRHLMSLTRVCKTVDHSCCVTLVRFLASLLRSCHVMLSCHVTSCDIMSCHVLPCPVGSSSCVPREPLGQRVIDERCLMSFCRAAVWQESS